MTILQSEPRTRSATAPVRILCVDDNRDLADSYHLMLDLHGYDVTTCYDGFEAVEVAAAIEPDVCLIDLHMPGMAGDEVARRIKAASGGHSPVMIAITAMSGDLYRVMTSCAGFDRHLVKPVDPKQLMLIIENELSERHNPSPSSQIQ